MSLSITQEVSTPELKDLVSMRIQSENEYEMIKWKKRLIFLWDLDMIYQSKFLSWASECFELFQGQASIVVYTVFLF